MLTRAQKPSLRFANCLDLRPAWAGSRSGWAAVMPGGQHWTSGGKPCQGPLRLLSSDDEGYSHGPGQQGRRGLGRCALL